MSRSSELQSALNDFLAEVDTINSECIALFDHAPRCEWIVQVDPATHMSSYRHVLSGQIESVMPKAYEQYLIEFDQFMQNKAGHPSAAPTDTHDQDSFNSSDECTTKSRVANKRKHPPVDEIASSSHTDSLQGLLGYSDSSGAEKESYDGLNARQRRRMKRAHRRSTTNARHLANVAGSSEASESAEFIGPLLPPAFDFQTTFESKDSLVDESDEIVGPKPPPSSDSFSHTSVKLPPPPDQRDNHNGKYASDPDRRAIEDSVQTLFDQFTALSVTLPDIAQSHLLFIQLSTRFEDWKSGFLDSNYFVKKLSELGSRLCTLVSHGLPANWICSWDSARMHYVYTDIATGRVQSEPPGIVHDAHHRLAQSRPNDMNNQSDSSFRRTNATEAPIDHVNPRSPEVTNTKGTSPEDDIQVGFTDKTTSVAAPSIAPECLEPGPTENDSVEDRKQIDRTEHLIAQLREFEEVCRVYEDLAVSAPTALIETGGPLRAAQPELTLNNEPEKVEKCSKSRDKRIKVLPSNSLVGGKAIPNLMRKWQQLQESL